MAQTKLKPCDCKDWKESMPQIEAAQIMFALHSYGSKYTGKQFVYCPWCGKKREEITDGFPKTKATATVIDGEYITILERR